MSDYQEYLARKRAEEHDDVAEFIETPSGLFHKSGFFISWLGNPVRPLPPMVRGSSDAQALRGNGR